MDAPPAGTVERWAFDYILASDLAAKLGPEDPPDVWRARTALRLSTPGRAPQIAPRVRKQKTPGAGALVEPARRAQVLHAFLHHEVQAAELMCWAILAFPEAPFAFRRGLLGIARDELRHVAMYREHLIRLGHDYGAFPVNDWFWLRVPTSPSPAHFTAVLGIGFEGANLDHAPRFAQRFREAGDERGAALQEQVGREEIPHVAFALHWFAKLAGPADFEAWRRYLPSPLTPTVMRGLPLNRADRALAGYSDAFLGQLERWDAPCTGS